MHRCVRVVEWIEAITLVIMLACAQSAFAQPASPPLPPPRPDRPVPVETPSDKPVEAKPEQKDVQADAEAAACIERLTALGLRFEKRPPVLDNACKVDNPVLVSGLSNDVQLSTGSLMECSLAEELVRWSNDVLLPKAKEHLQAQPKKILIGTSYQCRDQRSGTKPSEHAFGNALDVMGIEFDKRAPVTIKAHDEGAPEAAFQSAIRKEACPIFTTVLGPGADADHSDHLHLDMRGRKAGYRICQ
ncbi:extensin-like domain-containing protein [Microvirga sp. P5_D2]